MSLELFIARRIYADQSAEGKRYSRPAIRIAMLGVAIGVTVMIVSLGVVLGFQHEISNKVTGFGSHIVIRSQTQNENYEMMPVLTTDSLKQSVKSVGGIKHMQEFAEKLGMLKTANNFSGLTFKGIAADYDLSFFKSCLTEGKIPLFTDSVASGEILISQKAATDLQVHAGDKIFAYFLDNDNMRSRRFTIAGVYATHMADFDNHYVLTDIYTVRRLNGWDETMSSGLEIMVDDFDRVEEKTDELQFIHLHLDSNRVMYGVYSIKELAAHTFGWLAVLDMNVVMILILMILVSAFTTVSGLLIIMLERINMIGTLKVLGATNKTVRHIFTHFAIMLVGKGMLIGNVLGILLCLVQKQWHIMALDPSVYYIDSVPIFFKWLLILLVNVITLIISGIVIRSGSHLISIGRPAQTMRFD